MPPPINSTKEKTVRKNRFNRLPKLRIRHLIERLTMAKTGRCAFALIEVLAVAAAIGIVIGLLAPTIRKKSESENFIEQSAVVAANDHPMMNGNMVEYHVSTPQLYTLIPPLPCTIDENF